MRWHHRCDCETIAIWGRWLFNQILTMYFNGWQQMRWSRCCIITTHKKGISSIIDSQKCKPIKKLSFLPGWIQALTSKQNFFLFVKFHFCISFRAVLYYLFCYLRMKILWRQNVIGKGEATFFPHKDSHDICQIFHTSRPELFVFCNGNSYGVLLKARE